MDAISIEKAAVRARVNNIRLTTEEMTASVQELPAPGLGFAFVPALASAKTPPHRWSIAVSPAANPFFSSRWWQGWNWPLYFDPDIVLAVAALAIKFLEYLQGPGAGVVRDQRLLAFRE